MTTQPPSTINLGYSEIFLRPDGIIQVNGTNYDYTVKEIKESHRAALQLTGGKKFLLLLNCSHLSYIDKETREWLSSPEASEHVLARGYVIKNIGQSIVLNFLINFQGLPVPTKFFNNFDKTVQWLRNYHRNN